MLKKQLGFTLTETMVAVSVVGILAAIAIPSYGYYVNQSQVSEAFRLMDAQRTSLDAIHRTGSCTAVAGVPDTFKGKYGVLTISGTYSPSAGASCPSGCNVNFRYNSSGLNKEIENKVISAQLLNNGKLSKITGSTNIPDKYLPKEFRTIGVDAGDVCTKVADDPLVPTTGTYPTGTETGAPPPPPPTPPSPPPTPPSPPPVPPTPPVTPPPVTPPSPPPVPPVPPPPPTSETGTPTAPPPACSGTIQPPVPSASTLQLVVDRSFLNTSTQDSGYFTKSSINLYDFFTYTLKRVPRPNESIEIRVAPDVALLGFAPNGNQVNGAVVVDNRWPTTNISLLVYGLVAGYGGHGGTNSGGDFRSGQDGGTAIVNDSSSKLRVFNYGTIAGGGGGGQLAVTGPGRGWTTAGAGGGAPYGGYGNGNKGNHASSAGLLFGGDGSTNGRFGNCSRPYCQPTDDRPYLTGGRGGNLGQYGALSIDAKAEWRNPRYYWYEGKAGLARTGNVEIIESPCSKTLGR